MKPGYKTTEFWLTMLGQAVNVAGAIAGVISWPIAVPVAAGLSAVYTVMRSLIKATNNV